MSLTLDQFLHGISQEESGGNYHALGPPVNGDRAYGKYQVMGANVASWTRRALGYALTPQQFLASPSAQEKVAQAILGGYFRQYGAEGAAAMWFSGQPNPNKTGSDGSTTIRHYVDNVIAAAGGSPSAPNSGSSATGSALVPVTPKLSMDELAASYGLTTSLINSSSELKKLFSQAVKGSWTADLFTAHLKNTRWWQTQSDTLRQYVTLKYTDPASWKQKNDQAQYAMNALAVQVGLGDLAHGNAANKATLAAAVYNSVALGWSDARIKDWLGSKVTLHGGTMLGEAGQAFDQIHQLAWENGMKYNTWYFNEARRIAAGQDTMENAEAAIRQQAAAKYSAFADQIKAGQNVIDLASPYIQSVAKILEVPSTDVDLFNSHVSKAMTSNTNGQAYSIWQFENDLRKDPLWKKTQNAQDGAMQVAHQVLTQMGMTF